MKDRRIYSILILASLGLGAAFASTGVRVSASELITPTLVDPLGYIFVPVFANNSEGPTVTTTVVPPPTKESTTTVVPPPTDTALPPPFTNVPTATSRPTDTAVPPPGNQN